jgi:hypothetical protein
MLCRYLQLRDKIIKPLLADLIRPLGRKGFLETALMASGFQARSGTSRCGPPDDLMAGGRNSVTVNASP